MKKMLLVAALLVGSVAVAADAEHKVDATKDTSKNPMTGTTTTTETYTEKAHDKMGKADVKVTKKTKVKKDGSTSQSVKTESDTEAKTK